MYIYSHKYILLCIYVFVDVCMLVCMYKDALEYFSKLLLNICRQGDEQLYYNHVATITKLLDNLIKVDHARGDSGTLTREDFGAILADFFGTKDAESISMLVKAAEAELNIEEGTAINYKSLFAQVCTCCFHRLTIETTMMT